MPIHPVALWAQRSNATIPEKNLIFLTLEVQDPKDVRLDLTENSLRFSAIKGSGPEKYELDLEFYGEIDPKPIQKVEAGNHVSLVLLKKKAQEEYWPRLNKEKVKLHYIRTDFEKWVDEDEQDVQADDDGAANMLDFGGGNPDPSGMDFSKLMGGAGGAGSNFDISSLASQLGQSGAGLEDDSSEEEES